jgi:hypothetical protein
MKYTLYGLKMLVDEHNQNALAMLASVRPALFSGPVNLLPNMEDVRSSLPAHSLGSWTGRLSTNEVPPYDFVSEALFLKNQNYIAAVFSVVEDITKHGSKETENMPVALCVGINYIQSKTYTIGQALVHVTGMYDNATKAIKTATGASPKPFHLVAANFFPWVTEGSWSHAIDANGKRGINSLHEMLLLETCGFDDPVSHVRSLADILRPKWLIFHGVDNCVPMLGNTVRKLLRHEAIFCDNLAPPYHGKNEIRF